jgi:hypothetical protein
VNSRTEFVGGFKIFQKTPPGSWAYGAWSESWSPKVDRSDALEGTTNKTQKGPAFSKPAPTGFYSRGMHAFSEDANLCESA